MFKFISQKQISKGNTAHFISQQFMSSEEFISAWNVIILKYILISIHNYINHFFVPWLCIH